VINRYRCLAGLYWVIAAVEGLTTLFLLVKAPTDPKNILLLGFSLGRLAVIVGVLAITLTFLYLGLKTWWVPNKLTNLFNWIGERRNIIFGASAIVFFLGWIGVWLPPYQMGKFQDYYVRFYPIIVWIMLIGAQTFFTMLSIHGLCWKKLKDEIKTQRPIMLATVITLISFIISWVFIALSRIGLTPDVDFWNEGGVPILGLQIVVAWSIGILIFIFTRKFENIQLSIGIRGFRLRIAILDVLIFLLIWACAVLVWNNEPIRRSYFTAVPSSPNYEYYPFSDAAVYDLGGQYVLIGKGINNGQFTDKPLYMLFLAFLHAIGGQDYMHIIRLQILCLAFFPAILYLLGKGIHGRLLGLLVAIMAIFKERNAIAATLNIQVSHSKLMMAELSTALLLAMLSLIIFKWFKEAQGGRNITLLSGGILGAAALLRPNPLLLLPLILIVAIFVYKFHWRQWFLSSMVFILGFALVFSPWTISAKNQNGNIFLLTKIKLILRRYKITIPTNDPLSDIPNVGNGFGLSSQQTDQDITISGLFGTNSIAKSAKILPMNFPNYQEFFTPHYSHTAKTSRQPGEFIEGNHSLSGFVNFVPMHFLHNQITSLVILPLSFQFLDLNHTLNMPMWDLKWDGRLSLEGKFLLFINLSLIALGIAVAWNRHKWSGLIPVIVNIGYYLANAFARTSGSRYLVPADWTILFYYSLGLVQIFYWLLILLGKSWDISVQNENQPSSSTTSRISKVRMAGTVVGLLIMGLSLPLSGKVIQPVYPEENKRTTLKTINQLPMDMPIAIKDLEAFIKQKNARAIYGRALYPRFYPAGKGGCYRCVMIDYAYLVKDYSRLSMTVIGPYNASVILPLSIAPKSIPDGSDVYVIGCGSGYRALFNARIIDALMVIIVGEERNTVYIRSPIPKTFECPMR